MVHKRHCFSFVFISHMHAISEVIKNGQRNIQNGFAWYNIIDPGCRSPSQYEAIYEFIYERYQKNVPHTSITPDDTFSMCKYVFMIIYSLIVIATSNCHTGLLGDDICLIISVIAPDWRNIYQVCWWLYI